MVKRVLIWLGRAALALVALLALFVGYAALDGIPHYAAEPPKLQVEVTPERVARGQKLASLTCAGCHADPLSGRFTGKHMTDLPAVFGDIYSANITRDKARGIGGWSDGELALLLRSGISRDGRYVPPWMIKLPHLSDEDLASLIAFLRSDDPRVAAADVPPPGVTRPSLLAKVLAHTIMKPIPMPARPIVMPPKSDRVQYGKYLVFALDCFSCHSADFKKVDLVSPEKSAGFFGGGNTLIGVDGAPIYSANITPDEATGIGRWSEQDFVRAVGKGFRPDGRSLHYPMLPRPELDEDELTAMFAYLRSVPKLHNEVQRPRDSASAQADSGQRLYVQYGCSGCHGESGAGAGGFADLRQANAHYPSDDELRAWIADAPSKKPGTLMPRWQGVIRDADYAPLLAHVRKLSAAKGQVL